MKSFLVILRKVGMPQISPDHSIGAALRRLAANPGALLVKQWNWKTALLSSLWRASLFAAVAARHGLHAAAGAGAAELILQMVTAGFSGSLAQTFCHVRPSWHGLVAMIAFALSIQHPLEFSIHWVRGTPSAGMSVVLSMAVTAASAVINAGLMRRGWLIVGATQ